MAEFILHCFAESGNAYKVALMLELNGADWEPRFVDFFHGATRSPEFRALNEMGEVPVLQHGGLTFSQSGVILDYLAAHFGRFGFETEGERREILRWLLWDNHKLTSYTATWRYLNALKEEGQTPVAQEFRNRSRSALAILNAHMAPRAWVALDRPTIADLSLCGYLFFDDEIGVDFPVEFPHLAAWLGRIKSISGWKHPYDLMPRGMPER